ncbi:MAG: OmpA family protein [Candidatus Omnitrophica bacterium]|nr:OmpA family protein [Candidatus Omnitrophota bacterium]MDD5670429.1 OmpA family protein [Candidatus Omnitrophota bacterium]
MTQEQAATIQSLQSEVVRLNQELDQVINNQQSLERAKSELEDQLRKEVDAGNLSVSMQDRGLVVTLLSKVLFESGKTDLKESSKATLDTVAQILAEKVGEHMVYVEGHTDDEPIEYSEWPSNWELSTARATNVIHYFVDEKGMDPRRLAAVGYGEFHPIADNSSEEGKSQNRRVDVVISPQKMMIGQS